MVINDVYELVSFIFKKEKSGHLKPSDFNIAIKSASRLLFNDKYRIYEDTQHSLDSLKPFMKTASLSPGTTTGIVGLPSDYRHKIAIYESVNSYPVDLVKNEHWAGKINSKIVAPEAKYPIARIIEDNKLEFRPLGLNFKLDYLIQDDSTIVWAFTDGTGRAVFDEGSSVDVLWSEDMVEELASRVLLQFGVSLKDSDVTGYAVQLKQTEIQ